MEALQSHERNFLRHLILLIKENMEKQSQMSKSKNDFESGKSLAYYEVGGFVCECSRLFNIPLSSLGITDFNPESLL